MIPLGPIRRAVVKSAVGAARFRLTGHRAPLAVTLVLTHRCDSSCASCGVPLNPRAELDTSELLDLIDHLAVLGTARVNLTGGEPLSRPDVGALVDRCAEHGMWTVLDTNGHQLPRRIAELRRVDRLMVGLHGPQEVHDRVAEPGAFAKAMAGIAAARAAGLRVDTVTQVGKHTLATLAWVLADAEAHRSRAVFQLVQTSGALASKGARRQLGDNDDLRRAWRWLLEARLAGRPVGVSEKVLRYLCTWPDYSVPTSALPHEDLHCMAGQVSCVVESDGGVHSCLPRAGAPAARNVRDDGFDVAFASLRDEACQSCADTPCAEANFLYNLNTPVVLDVARAGVRTILGGAA